MPLAFERVTYRYGDGGAPALDDVNLVIEDGSFTCIAGHTGSGKSTLAEHLNATRLPSSGRVVVDGIDTADKSRRRELRRLVGHAMQYPEYQLFAETVADDVAFGPRNLGWPEREVDRAVRESFEMAGLSYADVAQASPFDLSGGQRRRAALAGILAMRPRHLVLDEPAAGLDPQGRAEVLAAVRAFNERGATVVMVSHSMDDVAELADRVAVLSSGRLVLEGTPADVFAHPDVLAEAGLEQPSAMRAAAALRARGFSFTEKMPLTLDELARQIAADLGGGRR